MKKFIILSIIIFYILCYPKISIGAEIQSADINITTNNQEEEQINNNQDNQTEETDEKDIDIDEENDIYNNPNAIILDTPKNKQKLNIRKKSKINTPTETIDTSEDFRISPQNINNYSNPDIYSKKTTSYTNEKNYKDMTFGAKYNNSFTPNTFDQTRTLFTKYQKNKFTLNTSYKNSSLTSFDQQFKGTFSFSPEYKINNKISFQNVYSRNLTDRSNKNEIIFTLKPFKDDRMDLNLGAGQIYYEGNAPTRSQFNFSTNFKF